MKKRSIWVFVTIFLLAVSMTACAASPADVTDGTNVTDTKKSTNPVGSPEERQGRDQHNTEIMPETVLQLGESYDYFPLGATGHLRCTVTAARAITSSDDCPPCDMFSFDLLCATENGKTLNFRYPEWFTEGGAIDHGCHIIMVDVTVTNVDAVGTVYDGTDACEGEFSDPTAFTSYFVANLVDLSDVYSDPQGYSFTPCSFAYFSLLGQYSEDIADTPGDEAKAIQIAPGETVSYTLGYLVHANRDETPKDLSMLMLCGGNDAYAETGTFIDLCLEDKS